MEAERYTSNPSPYRYNVTTVITVTSSKVDLVRSLIASQAELLKQGSLRLRAAIIVIMCSTISPV